MRGREQVISDITTGNLTVRRDVIGPAERHAAIGRSGAELGPAIDRLRAQHRPKDEKREGDQEDFELKTGREVVTLLLETAERSFPDEMDAIDSVWDKRKLAVMALMERTVRRCDTCRGRREVQVPDNPTIVCPACQGSGRAFRPSSATREAAFGRKIGRHSKERLALNALLATWDNNEHATAGAVADNCYAAEEAT